MKRWASTRRHPTKWATVASRSSRPSSWKTSTPSSPRRRFIMWLIPPRSSIASRAALRTGGRWSWSSGHGEEFNEATAAWCFQRLGPDDKAGWLHRRRDEWVASGQSWSAYVRAWARDERLHSAGALLRLLDERFQRAHFARGPYFFPDLALATEGDERAAIEAGQIRATRVDYVGVLR